MQAFMVLSVAHTFIKHLERPHNTANVIRMNQLSATRISVLEKSIQPLRTKLVSKSLVL